MKTTLRIFAINELRYAWQRMMVEKVLSLPEGANVFVDFRSTLSFARKLQSLRMCWMLGIRTCMTSGQFEPVRRDNVSLLVFDDFLS